MNIVAVVTHDSERGPIHGVLCEAFNRGHSIRIHTKFMADAEVDFYLFGYDMPSTLVEMKAATIAAPRGKLVHLGAGDDNTWPVYDTTRHTMTVLSNIVFTHNIAKHEQLKVRYPLKLVFWSGPTNLDSLPPMREPKDVPPSPFTLVHVPEWRRGQEELDKLSSIIAGTVVLVGQGRPYVPRPEFLWLLSHCAAYMSNSSSAIFETKLLQSNAKLISVGSRNAYRTVPDWRPPGEASKFIVDMLQEVHKNGKANR